MKGQKAIRILHGALCVLLAVFLAAQAIGICREGAAYRAEGHPDAAIYTPERVGEALRRALPLFCAALGTAIAGAAPGKKNEEETARDTMPAPPPAPRAGRRQRLLWAALLCAALGLIAAGALNGGMRDVLYKAVKICSECVGLG